MGKISVATAVSSSPCRKELIAWKILDAAAWWVTDGTDCEVK